jgi:hypothetical protein
MVCVTRRNIGFLKTGTGQESKHLRSSVRDICNMHIEG